MKSSMMERRQVLRMMSLSIPLLMLYSTKLRNFVCRYVKSLPLSPNGTDSALPPAL